MSALQGGDVFPKSEKYKFAIPGTDLLWSGNILFNCGMRSDKEKTENVDDQKEKR